MESLAERDLARLLAGGSDLAFEELFNRYFDTLLNYAMSFMKDRHNAEDVCADVFTAIWEKRESLANIEKIKAYLLISVRNACINRLNSSAARMRTHMETISRHQELADSNLYLKTITEQESKEKLRRQIEKLPEQCKRIFKFAFFDGLSAHEIAAIMDINYKTVHNQKLRAIRLLRLVKDLLVTSAMILYFSIK